MQISVKSIFTAILLIITCNHLSAQIIYSKGLDFDDAGYAKVLKKAKLTRSLESVPAAASIKMYAPYPKSQGAYQLCEPWQKKPCY